MGNGQAIAGFSLSIVGLVFSFLGPLISALSLGLSIAGLVLSVTGGHKLKAMGQPTGLATAGRVIGIIAVVFSAIMFFTCGLCTICAAARAGAVNSAAKDAADALEDALKDLQ